MPAPKREEYYTISEAVSVVEICAASERAVIGVEGFRKIGRGLLPLLDEIMVFAGIPKTTWSDYKRACNLATIGYLKGIRTGTAGASDIRVSLTIVNKPDYQPDP